MEIDYSFLNIGGLYQTAMDVMYEAYVRFGVKKADSVYSTARVYIREHGEKSLALAV